MKVLSSELKVFLLKDVGEICQKRKANGEAICLTIGVYDIIHGGHIRYIMKASEYGNLLVVGINSDELVRFKKGPSRPIRNEKDRALVIASLSCVDLVIVFNDYMEVVQTIQPDFFVVSSTNGKDRENREDCQWVRKQGGVVIMLEEMSQTHSSDMIEKIKGGK